MDDRIEKALRQTYIFKDLPDKYIKLLATYFKTIKVKKGEAVFYQYDESTDFYIVLEGKLQAYISNEEGEDLVLAVFKPGDVFGEMSLFDGKPRSATVEAKEDSVLGVLSRKKFIEILKENSTIAIELLKIMVKRLREADKMIEALAFFDVSDRLLKALVTLAKEEGEKTKEGGYRIKKKTHRELASLAGSSREAVTKAMKALTFRNFVKQEGDYIYISPEAEEYVEVQLA